MCLDTLDKKFVKPPKDQVFVGYKVMFPAQTPGKKTHWEPLFHGSYLPENVWRISHTLYRLYTALGHNPYPSGFHIYATKRAAKLERDTTQNSIVKVEFSHVLAKGIQNGLKVFIAKRIRILGSVK